MRDRDEGMKLKIGDSASISQTATASLIEEYANASGDYNPVHFDDRYAKSLGFEGCIMHGLFCMGMISNLVGTVLPGQGTIFVNEEVRYLCPVYIGDEITATVRVLAMNSEKKRVEVGFNCKNQSGFKVIEGKTSVVYKLI